jgi:hypothetical protein
MPVKKAVKKGSTKATGRDYRKEYDEYHGTAEQRKRRSNRNLSRTKMVKAGAVKKGQDVHHKDGNPSNKKRSNMKAESVAKNRGRKT